MSWIVELRKDLAKGPWHPTLEVWVWFEVFFITARRGNKAYIHFREFVDDYDGARNLLDRIHSFPDFTPEGKPGIWLPIIDLAPWPPPRRLVIIWPREPGQRIRVYWRRP